MKICHVSAQDIRGGAARAATRHHLAQLGHGHESRMLVSIKGSDLASVCGPVTRSKKAINLLRPHLARLALGCSPAADDVYRSFNLIPSRLLGAAPATEADVINLHWVGGECLSVREIGAIEKPHIWTLHDMWAFCGAEHVAVDNADARWRTGYHAGNRPSGTRWVDWDRWVWKRKRSAWRRGIQLIAPSRWLARCVQESALMAGWPVSVIPNVLDVDRFRPLPKKVAREIMGLPDQTPLVLFGAMDGSKDKNKGWDLLQEALDIISKTASEEVECVIFGQSEPLHPPGMNLPVHWLGRFTDDVALALIYSAADVMVVPSRIENLPQTGTEAQACGCPVVAFDTSGLPDVVEHGVTGYLATAYDPHDLAAGIRWVLGDRARLISLGVAARDRAVRLWSPQAVVPQYVAAYEQAIAQWRL